MHDSPETLYNEHDRRTWEEELADFVPDRLFDAHCHLFNPESVPDLPEKNLPWQHTDLDRHTAWANILYPGRSIHFLFLGTPVVGINLKEHNDFLIRQTQKKSAHRCHCLVTPETDPKDLDRWLSTGQVQGVKPYRLFSKTGDVDQCRITDFLPESLLEVVHQHGAWVTMHLSRFQGCADELNLRDLERFTQKQFPKIQWILAHCARSFTYYPIRQAVDRLEAMPNIYYDLSAVCDVRPFLTLFQKARLDRIFWGSDGVEATFFHGSYAPLGRSWVLTREEDLPTRRFSHCSDRPVLAVYETLLAIKQAAEFAGLSRDQVNALFCDNAERLFSIENDAAGNSDTSRLTS